MYVKRLPICNYMKKITLTLGLMLISGSFLLACTNFIVTQGASKDGSVMIVYTCDGEFHPHLRYMPAADHPSGAWLPMPAILSLQWGTICPANI